jgi:hypothetical protein
VLFGEMAGIGVLGGYAIPHFARMVPATSMVTVTRWGGAGYWAMLGGATKVNFWFAGLNGRYAFEESSTVVVPRAWVGLPQGENWLQVFYRFLAGQRYLKYPIGPP